MHSVFVDIRTNSSSFLNPQTIHLEHKVVALVVSAYTCGIIALISRILSVYTMVLVTRNFGKGLKSRSE